MNKRVTILILLSLLVIGGGVAFIVAFLASPPPAGQATANTPSNLSLPSNLAQPSVPKCADVFVPGKKIDIQGADFACADPDGTIQGLAAFRCNDGRHLWQVDAAAGPPAGYGFSGEPYMVANDAAYSQAYDKCKR